MFDKYAGTSARFAGTNVLTEVFGVVTVVRETEALTLLVTEKAIIVVNTSYRHPSPKLAKDTP